MAAELGVMVVAPDTSPRGEGVPDDPEQAYDFGLGAGFYVDATQPPWSANYRMYSYVAVELPALIAAEFPADMDRQAISGHSMGGHGALTLGLKAPGRFRSISAFSPIVSPMNCPWGDQGAVRLSGRRSRGLARPRCGRPDRGRRAGARRSWSTRAIADPFLARELKPELLEQACARAGQPLRLRRQPGYDHSYSFIASFIEDHLRWHARQLA